MLEAKNGEELLRICESENISLSEYAIRIEMENREITREEAYARMRDVLQAMKDGANEGRAKEVYSVSGLIGGDGYKMQKYLESKETLTGDVIVKAMAMALSSSEVNASMGRIVACPTAGCFIYFFSSRNDYRKKCNSFWSRRRMSGRMWFSISYGSSCCS